MKTPGIAGFLAIALMCIGGEGRAQDFTFVADDTVLTGPLGSEIVFNCTITNTSALTITLAIVRTGNDLPAEWSSSMCLDVCYPPVTDSILTSPAFGSSPLSPGESRPFSMHVYTATNPGTGTVRVESWDTRNPSERRLLTFAASATPNGVEVTGGKPAAYALSECFPNPFNPSTPLRCLLPGESRVTLRVYNLNGEEVTTLARDRRESGSFDVRWEGRDFRGVPVPSGIYFCRMDARPLEGNGHFSSVRKLLLLK